MNTHKNARLIFQGRALLIRRIHDYGQGAVKAAQAVGISTRSAYKGLERYRTEGEAGLFERSCRPHRYPHQLARAEQRKSSHYVANV